MNELLERWAAEIAGEMTDESAALEALEEAESIAALPPSASVAARLPEKGTPVRLTRVYARCLDAEGRVAEANRALFALAERLNQAGFHRALGHLLRTLLPREPHHAAPLVARTRHLGGAAAVSDDMLFEAQALHPGHGLLAWLAAETHLARGETASARRLAAIALPELVAEKSFETAESALLLLAEDPSVTLLPALGRALEILARNQAWDTFDTAFTLLESQITSPTGAVALWPVVREIWRHHPQRDALRAQAGRVLRVYLTARYPEPEALVHLCEIDRPSQPAEVVLDRLEKGEQFPPGFFARHAGWGMGRIRQNDTEALVIDFPQKPLHRMTLATAKQALTVLAPGDLRVLLTQDPEGLRHLAAEEPATVVVKALQIQKEARASAEELRKLLVPEVISPTAWPTWWKEAKDALAADPRIDHRKAYANSWSLVTAAAEEETPLPSWNPDEGVLENLVLFATFLEQQPGEREALLEAERARIDRLAAGRGATAEEAAAAGLWLLRFDPASTARPEDHVVAGFDINQLSRVDQEKLLPRLTAPPALVAALNSRLVGVRRTAGDRLRAADPDGRLRRAVLTATATLPDAVLELLETSGEPGALPAGEAGWSRPFLLAVLDFLEQPPRESHRKRALAQVAAGSSLDALLRAHPIPEDERNSIVSRLVKWHSSDRFRFPLLDFLRGNGHEDIAQAVDEARARAAARTAGRVGHEPADPYDGAMLLTRVTFSKLEAERQRVGLELKTTIPKAIQKARELGDLRENAEYESAKAKQAVYAKRFTELEAYLSHVRLIDDLRREAGVAAPGTQVVLRESGGERRWTYWILGEGDQELGAEVVSYKAPLGKLLLGRRVGDALDFPQDQLTVPCEVESIEVRIP